jgi:3-methylcrotonyl-CoA carboxylase alpha subunit
MKNNMFTKILIANRGEIACRVMATARRLGIATVAVYSDADAGAKHVALADEAVRIGPAPVADSYLRGDVIIRAALATGAQAIHPGYGLLSENPEFVDAVAAAGLVFIGPSARAIRAMGLKDAAKTVMEQAGVPVVPGYHGAEQDAGHLAREAAAIGYPVLIKARAGGGGKGMRLVERPEDFSAALAGAQREGLASFGDAAVLIERYVSNPRHIEIQVFGDAQGNVVHLFERDCSLQRRHQKVIEEAPAPGMTAEVRTAMGRAAVEAARAIGYQGAGTVEFIADGSTGLRADGFWFMEMNTRLQVEHPVSEAITGLDFVELQLRVAAGEPLPFGQQDLQINGHAFEARIYAEDVVKGFLPATGQLDHLAFPAAVAFERGAVRVDSGVRQGDAISPWYDPMIAKLIVHGPTRAAALNQLSRALTECHVAGLVTNLGFLSALARHAGFAAGTVDTGLIGRDLATLQTAPAPDAGIIALAAIAGLGLVAPRDEADPWQALAGWRHWGQARQFVTLLHAGQEISTEVTALDHGSWQVTAGDAAIAVKVVKRDGTGFDLHLGDHRRRVDLVRIGAALTLFADGQSHLFTLPDALQDRDAVEDGGDALFAPMPGLVKLVAAVPGQSVAKGDVLAVLEAMKMEHSLTAPRDGVVAEVLARVGDQVVDGAKLLALRPAND